MDEDLTPGAEGLEEEIGQLGVLGHQRAEAQGGDPVHATALDDASDQIDGLASEHVELAEKRARTEPHERLLRLVRRRRLDDLDRRVVGQDQVIACVARAVENLAGLDRLRHPIGTQTRELSSAQLRIRNRICDLRFWGRHRGFPPSVQLSNRSTFS